MDIACSLAAPDRSGDRLHWRMLTARHPGAGSRAPVLLLHGLASNLSRWSEFISHTRLADQRDVARIDLRGHGLSTTRRALSLELWSQDLAALLDTGFGDRVEQAIVVGHSLGAQVALHFASTQPRRVRAMVLIDPVFRGALHGKWRRVARYGPLFAAAARGVRALNAVGVRRSRLPELDLAQMDREARIALRDPASEEQFIRRYSSTWSDLKTFRTAHYLQELVQMFRPLPAPATYAMPVLVLLSTGATFATLEETRAIAATFPHGEIDTIDCHHWPLTERPVEVRERIERWCDALDADDRAATARGD